MTGGGRTGDRGGTGRWTEDTGPAASWGEVSVMVVDCDVDEVGLELSSCLLLDFSESFALRSLR